MVTSRGAVRMGAGLGMVSAVLFSVVVGIMGFFHPGYSHLTNFISDLGAFDAVGNPYVQRLNFFQLGIGNVALGWAYYQNAEPRSRLLLGAQTMIGLGVFLSGIFSGHANDPNSSASMWHDIVGMPAFLLIMIVPFLAGRRFARHNGWRTFSLVSKVMSPVLVIWFIQMASADGATDGMPGLYQRLFVGTWLIWMVTLSVHLLRKGE